MNAAKAARTLSALAAVAALCLWAAPASALGASPRLHINCAESSLCTEVAN